MNQQPDKLFRDKLESFSRPAPASAWDKLEADLDKKNSTRGLWWKVAASLLLLAIAGYILWSATRNNTITPSQSIARKSEPLPQKTSPETKHAIIHPAKDSVIKQQKEENTAVEEKATHDAIERKVNTVEKEEKNIAPSATSAEVQQELLAESVPPQEKTNELTPTTSSERTEVVIAQQERVVLTQTNITLVFSADETESYLNKNVSGEATDEAEKPSTLKKLLKKAQDLKNNQDPVGELRQKKNEILALNFKNEKRGQNK